MEEDPLKIIEKRTQRYWYQDGIWEIGFGGFCALLGFLYLASSWVKPSLPLHSVMVLLQMVVLVTSALSVNWLVKMFKQRITYPRTGFVTYRKPAGSARFRRFILTVLFAAGVAALVGIVAALRVAPNRIPLIISVILAATMAYLGYRFNLLRYYAVAALTIGVGFTISYLRVDEEAGTGVFFLGFGLLVALSGAVTLATYLKNTRPAPLEDYETTIAKTEDDESRDID